MKKSAFICLLSSFIFLSTTACASHREIDIKWKVGDSPNRKMNLEWFQGDSIGFNLTSKMNREPFVFATNDVLIWEVRGWIGDHTNLYAVSTGTVVNAESGESRYELTVEQTANLPEGTCLGYVKTMQFDGTNLFERVVLGGQWINVEWSETAQDYEITGPLAKPYTTPAELAAIEAALSNDIAAVGAQVSAVSGRVDQVEADLSDLSASVDVKQDAATAATDAELAAAVADAPNWSAAYAWGNHALAGYLTSYSETDPAFAAWNKSTGITITENQISDLQSYLTAESDPAWHSGTGAIYSAIATKQDAATAATDAELSAAVADAPNWTAAYAWGNHALAGYLTSYSETDPAFAAWNKSTGISITESQISDLQSYLTAESDPAWHSGTGAIYSAIATKQDAATAATDAELTAGLATKADITEVAEAAALQSIAGNISNSYVIVNGTHIVPFFRIYDGRPHYSNQLSYPDNWEVRVENVYIGQYQWGVNSGSGTQELHSDAYDAMSKTAYFPPEPGWSSVSVEFVSGAESDHQTLESSVASSSCTWNKSTNTATRIEVLAGNYAGAVVYRTGVQDGYWQYGNTLGEPTIYHSGQYWVYINQRESSGGLYYRVVSDDPEPPVSGWESYSALPEYVPVAQPVPFIDLSCGGKAADERIADLESGTEDFEGITLDSTIESWSDIGLTYSNAVRQNFPITITNGSGWPGWATTGDLDGDDIFLDTDEYLLSPIQANGIADWKINQNGTGRINWTVEIVTNGVLAQTYAPYHGTNGQLKITAGGPLPMMSEGMTVSNPVTIYGFQDSDEAGTIKYVSGIRRIESESHPDDLTRKSFVEGLIAGVKSWFTSKLDDYANNADKTLRGSQLRLGNMWVVSPADASGERWVCSGGEINGEGELVGTTNAFIISKNDYPLLSFTSGASGLNVPGKSFSQSGSDVTVSLLIATNGVTSAPFAEWAEAMTVNEWNRIQTYDVETYPTASGGTYELTFTLPLEDQMFFRVMQQQGESIMTVYVDRMNLGDCKFSLIDIVSSNTVRLAVSNGTVVVIQE